MYQSSNNTNMMLKTLLFVYDFVCFLLFYSRVSPPFLDELSIQVSSRYDPKQSFFPY